MSNFKRKVNIVESTTPPTNQYDWWYDLNSEVLKKPVNGAYISISNGESSLPIEEEGNTNAGVLYCGSEGEDDVAHMRIYSDKNIPVNAFQNRADITSALVLEGTKNISDSAFNHCVNLCTISLPNSVQTLGRQAFAFCNLLERLHLPNSLEKFDRAFPVEMDCVLSSITGKYTVNNTFVVKDNSLYYTCPNINPLDIDAITIPEVKILKPYSVSVTTYTEEGDYDEEGNDITNYYGTKIKLPDTLQDIEDEAFGYGCCGISEFSGKYSRDGIFVIKDGKLYVTAGCQMYYKTDITIPNDVTVIEKYAFWRHHTVSNIYISDSVKTIQTSAFAIGRECNIYINNTIPPTLENSDGISSLITIYVPSSAVDNYKQATNWAKHADRIVGYDFN